ncbi:MAG: glycosyltransferase family 2 protein [Methanobrevibacter sp.]|jgi:glycosyltransferase involved in cell wall biosynthesis|nr:glycosyltransferase family 2 protein [Candidatus Methanoflexus mossambicus]
MTLVKYKISIIIPVYNVENYIKKAFDSIKTQTLGFDNLEIIMVNDGSTDKSGEIIERYADKYSNCKSIHLDENTGAAGIPRNIGIEHSSSNYIMFLDPDDFYENNACEILYDKIVNEKVDIVFGTFFKITQGKKILATLKIFNNQKQIKVKNIDENKKLLLTAPSIWTKIIKKEFIIRNNIKFPPNIPGEDAVFMVEAFLKAKGIIYLSDIVVANYVERETKDSITTNITLDYFKGVMESRKLIYRIFKNNGKEKCFKSYAKKSLDFYLMKLISSDINDTVIMEKILNEMKWFIEKCLYYQIKPKNDILRLLFNLIANKNIINILLLKNYYKPTNQKINKIKNLESENKQLISKNKQHISKNKQLISRNKQHISRNKQLISQNKYYISRNKNLEREIIEMKSSNSWKLTKPLRKLGKIFR